MKAVAIVALLVLFAVAQCGIGSRIHTKKPEKSSWNSAGFVLPRPTFPNWTLPKVNWTLPRINLTRPTWMRFAEETSTKPKTRLGHRHQTKPKKVAPAPAPVAPETASWNPAGIKFPNWTLPKVNWTLPKVNWTLPHFNISRPTWMRFAEETPAPAPAPMKLHHKIIKGAKDLWAKRPWAKKTAPTPAAVVPETSSWNSAGFVLPRPTFPNWTLPKVNWSLPHFNISRPTWMRFAEETPAPAPAPVKLHHKIINGAKALWAKRPWAKKTAPTPAAVVPETASWNPAGFKFPNVTRPLFQTWNITLPKPSFNFTRPTWMRFAEESNIFDSIKNAVKGLWAKRPWVKKAENKTAENKTEESAWTSTTTTNNGWNSQGVTFPVPTNSWNSNGYTFPVPNITNTWNSAGYRFAEETTTDAQPQSLVDKVKGHVKGLWAKRPWAKKTKAE